MKFPQFSINFCTWVIKSNNMNVTSENRAGSMTQAQASGER